MKGLCVCVLSGAQMLQCQAEVFGAPPAEDLRCARQIQQPEERAGAGQAQPHAGARQVEPRVSVELLRNNVLNLTLCNFSLTY